MKNVTLPRYTIGPDALNNLERVVSAYGRKVALIHGAKAYAACQALLTPAQGSLDVVREVCYGQEATYENVARLTEDPDVRRADVLIGIGGGKCLDTVKLAGDQLGKPVVTIATIASTCAAVTKISIMYNADGSFKDIPKLKAAPGALPDPDFGHCRSADSVFMGRHRRYDGEACGMYVLCPQRSVGLCQRTGPYDQRNVL